METTNKELSYFRLKLESYLSDHFPEMMNDTDFVTARADKALTTYCDAVAQGFTHPEAESVARAKHSSKGFTSPSTTRWYRCWRMSLKRSYQSPCPKELHLFFWQTRRSKPSLPSTI